VRVPSSPPFESLKVAVAQQTRFVIHYESLNRKKFSTIVEWPDGLMRTKFVTDAALQQ